MGTVKYLMYRECRLGKQSLRLAIEDPKDDKKIHILCCKEVKDHKGYSHKRNVGIFKPYKFKNLEKIEDRISRLDKLFPNIKEDYVQTLDINELKKIGISLEWID